MICVSIGEKSFEEISKVISKYDLLEIRLDLCKLTAPEIKTLFAMHPNLIAACREGVYSSEEGFELLITAIRAGAAFVDIDYDMPSRYKNELQETALNYSCKVIRSYHNFSETPGRKSLHEIYNKLLETDPDIIKIATMAHRVEDCSRLLSLYDYKSNTDYPGLIAIGMGMKGRVTRFAAPLLGAPFTYASIDSYNETADGQLDVDTMQEIFKLMSS